MRRLGEWLDQPATERIWLIVAWVAWMLMFAVFGVGVVVLAVEGFWLQLSFLVVVGGGVAGFTTWNMVRRARKGGSAT